MAGSEAKPKPRGFRKLLARFKTGLQKTSRTLLSPVEGIFGSGKISAQDLERVEEALYAADFGFETTEEVVAEIREAVRKEKDLRGQEAARIGVRVLERALRGAEGRWDPDQGNPSVVLLLGVNGAGKTTTAAKLAHRLTGEGHPSILGACDTFRAAANEQLLNWAGRLGVDLIRSHHGADAAAVAYDALSAARTRGKRVLILDTAGRLHTKGNLMEELKKIQRVLAKIDPDAPHHRWLVIDGSLGSNSIEQARKFHEAVGLTGLIVTKLDGTSRGGALTGIYRELGIPVFYVGLGEQPEDLQPFSISSYANAVFGVGEPTEDPEETKT